MTADTIFALASGAGRAGIAVIRISGASTRAALVRLGCAVPAPRTAARAKFTHPVKAEVIDHGLLLWFAAPQSFTGEDVAELHIHGGRAVIEEMLAALASIAGLRMAQPGEFTRRAFEHGKMDLTQAEALADLVDAETNAQARQALRQMSGALKDRYDGWRTQLIRAIAHLETVIDFPDEDLPADVAERLWAGVRTLAADIDAHLDDGGRGEVIREGLAVAIIGPPNAGKSSLLNALAGRDAAIVASSPGTTRDVIEVHLNLGGYAVTLADTAGLRDAADTVEQEGIRRSLLRAEAADIKIAVFDGTKGRDADTAALVDANTLVVVNKADLMTTPPEGGHGISAKTGLGLTAFLAVLTDLVKTKVGGQAAAPLTRARHRQALEECRAALDRALSAPLSELAAEDLRLGARALGRLTGRIDVEEILDVVFRDFCIGK
jgi:tRNA modification GTPase